MYPIRNGEPGGNPSEQQVVEVGNGYRASYYRNGEQKLVREMDGVKRFRPCYTVEIANRDGKIVQSFHGLRPDLEVIVESFMRRQS